MRVFYYARGVEVSKIIREVKVKDQKLLDCLTEEFNDTARCLEWVGGCTYYVDGVYPRIKSACLDELFQMFKAFKTGVEIPPRKCNFSVKAKS